MFGSIGAPELILIFIVALLVFGPRKLPELGRALGKGISEFRRATSDLKDTLEREVADAESAATVPSGALPAPRAPVTTTAAPPGSDQDGAGPSA